MQTVRVGVVRGGTHSLDYQKSISNGSVVLRALREHEMYEPVDILIDKMGVWHLDGVPVLPNKLIYKVDICISTINEPLADLGYVERIIAALGIKCIHTPKEALRGYIPTDLAQKVSDAGVRNSRSMYLDLQDPRLLKTIHENFSPPYTVNYINKWGNVEHVSHSMSLPDVVKSLEFHTPIEEGKYMMEEYIPGDEWAVTIVPNFRGAKYYTLHPVYMKTVPLPFKSNTPKTISSQHEFATPAVRDALDLYAKIAVSTMGMDIPVTLTFRHVPEKKPVLVRIEERHLLSYDKRLLNAIKENAISESEFMEILIRRK